VYRAFNHGQIPDLVIHYSRHHSTRSLRLCVYLFPRIQNHDSPHFRLPEGTSIPVSQLHKPIASSHSMCVHPRPSIQIHYSLRPWPFPQPVRPSLFSGLSTADTISIVSQGVRPSSCLAFKSTSYSISTRQVVRISLILPFNPLTPFSSPRRCVHPFYIQIQY